MKKLYPKIKPKKISSKDFDMRRKSKKELESIIEDYEGFLADVGQIEIDLMDAQEEYGRRYGNRYEY